MEGNAALRHVLFMTAIRVVLAGLVVMLAAKAADVDDVRSVLRRFNDAVRESKTESARVLFAAQADFRGGARTLRGAGALAGLFTQKPEAMSERTPPMLVEQGIRLVNPGVALVDANLVQYGSTIGKWSVPVVLVLEREGGEWRISAWRMPAWPVGLD